MVSKSALIGFLKWLEYATVMAGVFALSYKAWAAAAKATFLVAALWRVAGAALFGAALIAEVILVYQAYKSIETAVLTEGQTLSPKTQPIAARVVVYGLGLVPLIITLFLVAAFQAAVH